MNRILLSLALLLIAAPALAQPAPISLTSGKEGEIIKQPICTYLTNRSDQTIMGTISTAAQTIPSGDKVKHRDNFTLKSGERRQFCAAGPFYEGQRLEIMLRTIIPLFTCKTKINQEIFLDAKEDENGFKKLSATCY